MKSVSAGTVAYSGPMGTYGNTVILEHGGGDYSVYGSLDRIDVRKGSRVIKGQAIGTVAVDRVVGSVGMSGMAHPLLASSQPVSNQAVRYAGIERKLQLIPPSEVASSLDPAGSCSTRNPWS